MLFSECSFLFYTLAKVLILVFKIKIVITIYIIIFHNINNYYRLILKISIKCKMNKEKQLISNDLAEKEDSKNRFLLHLNNISSDVLFVVSLHFCILLLYIFFKFFVQSFFW